MAQVHIQLANLARKNKLRHVPLGLGLGLGLGDGLWPIVPFPPLARCSLAQPAAQWQLMLLWRIPLHVIGPPSSRIDLGIAFDPPLCEDDGPRIECLLMFGPCEDIANAILRRDPADLLDPDVVGPALVFGQRLRQSLAHLFVDQYDQLDKKSPKTDSDFNFGQQESQPMG